MKLKFVTIKVKKKARALSKKSVHPVERIENLQHFVKLKVEKIKLSLLLPFVWEQREKTNEIEFLD